MSDLAPIGLPEGRVPRAAPPEVRWPVFEQVPLADLVIDRAYQRPVSVNGLRMVAAIVAEFEPGAFGALAVWRVGDGRLAVVDGQHRALAALELGLERVPAMVFETAGAARVFLAINQRRIALRPFDRWRAAAAAGDPGAVALAGILEDLGLRAEHAVPKWDGTQSGFEPGVVLGCVGRAWAMLGRHGAPVLEAALGCLQEAEQANGELLLTSAMVAATCEVVATMFADPALEDRLGDALDVLARALAREDAEGWMARARAGMPAAVTSVPVRRLAEVIDAARLSEEG